MVRRHDVVSGRPVRRAGRAAAHGVAVAGRALLPARSGTERDRRRQRLSVAPRNAQALEHRAPCFIATRTAAAASVAPPPAGPHPPGPAPRTSPPPGPARIPGPPAPSG